MKKNLNGFLTLFLVFVVQISIAQEKVITGVVSDETGGLPGVTILKKGTTHGTETDFDGRYSIKAKTGDILSFSFVGMKTVEKTVGNNSIINVTLENDNVLEEVVVVGFGVQKRKSLTSSVSKVNAEEIKNIATPTISGALQGSANGLQVNQNSGTPGGSFSVRIRGASSINGSNEPLYVVDGVPILSGSLGTAFTGGQSNDVLANLNFSDIESVQILKDASSAAIYGSRGANGVVLITTKRGKAGKPQFSLNTYFGFQKAIKKPEVMTAGEYYKFADTAFISAFGAPLMSLGAIFGYSPLNDPKLGFSSLEELYASDFGDNYPNAIYRDRPAIVKQTDVTISGGNDKARYYVNYTDFSQEGTIKSQGFDRKSFTVNSNFNATDQLELETGFTLSKSTNSRVGGDNNIYGALTTSILEVPGYNLYNEDGTFNTSSFLFSNPLQNATIDQQDSETLRLMANFGLNYRFNDKVVSRTKISLERVDFEDLSFYPGTTRRGIPSNGEARKDINQIDRLNFTSTLNYNTQLGEIDLNALIGVSYEDNENDETLVSATQIPAGFSFPVSGAVPTNSSNFIRTSKLFSYFSRVGLSYQNKLFFEGTLRADTSSRFGDNFKTGYFPAASLGYLISSEDWFNNNVLTNLKARISWGQTGNQSGIDNYESMFLATAASNYAANPGTSISQLPSPNLSWETTEQTNFGIDATFFNKLDFTYDYYIKKTNNVLQDRPLRNSSGFTTVAANVGDIKNNGHEISINYRVFEGDFKWTTQFQIAYLKNEVTSIQKNAAGEFVPIDLGFATRVGVGQQLGAFYGLKADGLWQEGDDIPSSLQAQGVEAGDVKYIDSNGDGNINANDRTFIGNPLPTWTGNFRNTLAFGNFDFSANFQFEYDKDIFNATKQFGGASGSFAFNKYKSQLNYWTPENTNTNLPRPRFGALQSYNNQDSDRFIEDGSYVRLKEIVIGYTIDSKKLGNGVSLRIYAGADNLYTWTNYSGLDPEVNSFGNSNVTRGTDFFAQGLNRTYKFGLNFKF